LSTDATALEHELESSSAASAIAPAVIPVTRKRLTIMCNHFFIWLALNLSMNKKKEKNARAFQLIEVASVKELIVP